MAPRIYTSDLPALPIVSTSIFTRIFAARAPGDIGGFPGSQSAFVDGQTGISLTRAELLNLALSFGYGLQHHPTLTAFTPRGATVLIFSPNSLAWPVVIFGCLAAGLRCTTANSSYTSHELAHQYSDSGAGLVITAEDGITRVRAMFQELGLSRNEADRRTVVMGRDLRWAGGPTIALRPECRGLVTLSDLLLLGKLENEEQFEGASAHETVFICYSSGTTGKPKGVETTHQNVTTILDVLRDFFLEAQSGNNTALGFMPFYHAYGVHGTIPLDFHLLTMVQVSLLILHLPFTIGWSVVIQSGFEPSQFCRTIERFKIPFAFIVPPVLVVLARHPDVDKYDLSSLQYMLCGAAPVGGRSRPGCQDASSYKASAWRHLFDHTSVRTDGDHDWNTFSSLQRCREEVGGADDEGTVDAEDGVPGELWVRAKTVMKGYLNNPVATASSITPDGWFKTGDILVKDRDSFFYVVDRKKELIKYKGFQVAPAELESVLLTHPDIADVAVIGIESHEQATELPRAYVVHARSQEIKTLAQKTKFAQGVAKWMELKVAKHKHLRGGVEVIDAVPKSAAGKILRRELRQLAKQEQVDTTTRSKL
ncbi:4-coumarate--CoA ligase-like 7 [Mycena sanguinolenta]|uniref:4-coumarate--CoA ligase-like 7 n=1 Tax=Mycena sanguinolenta TaxID=230812 RepID=A0A8H6ZIY0_9AGAR|nr:4-coumarate--CoA ligase-like 7 [Mycena sanguinolenta]